MKSIGGPKQAFYTKKEAIKNNEIIFAQKPIKSYICELFLKTKEEKMKKGIHPDTYRTVVFKDFSCDESFLGKSCAQTSDTIVHEDGNEYPLIKLEISAMSHPFFTGKMKFVDTAGRIEKFNKKYKKKSKAVEAEAPAAPEASPAAEESTETPAE